MLSKAGFLSLLLVASVVCAEPDQPAVEPVVAASSAAAPVPAPDSVSGQIVPAAAPVAPLEAGPAAVQPVEPVQPQPVPVGVVHHPSVASHYASNGPIHQVVGEQVVKPVRAFEQYGQPEPASLPANYKPFGSWGLYIGGNPADGYYTNYYKALGNSVDKQQVSASFEPSVAKPVVSQTAAFSPVLRQASISPLSGADFYPFAYAPSELSSGSVPRVADFVPAVYQQVPPAPVPVHAPPASPVQVGAQIHGTPAGFEQPSFGVSSYADSHATKRLGAAAGVKEAQKEVTPGQSKGQHPQQAPRVYGYHPLAAGHLAGIQQASANPLVSSSQPQTQPQVVAYPIPVGSQIVGSQQGVDGAFAPYGVHAFTRYAVKPTLVSQVDPVYYYSNQVSSSPVYKQSAVYSAGSAYYPLSFYGYPLGQLHYSSGSISPVSHYSQGSFSPLSHYSQGSFSSIGQSGEPVYSQAHPFEVGSSDKAEIDDKIQVKPYAFT